MEILDRKSFLKIYTDVDSDAVLMDDYRFLSLLFGALSYVLYLFIIERERREKNAKYHKYHYICYDLSCRLQLRAVLSALVKKRLQPLVGLQAIISGASRNLLYNYFVISETI